MQQVDVDAPEPPLTLLLLERGRCRRQPWEGGDGEEEGTDEVAEPTPPVDPIAELKAAMEVAAPGTGGGEGEGGMQFMSNPKAWSRFSMISGSSASLGPTMAMDFSPLEAILSFFMR